MAGERELSKSEVEKILNNLAIIRSGAGLLNANRLYINQWKKTKIDLSNKMHITEDELKLAFGLRDLRLRLLDTTDGWLSSYAWHKSEDGHGTGISPLLFLISQVKSEIPSEEQRLHTLSRRITLLELLTTQLRYWQERYDWDELPIVFDVYVDIFENYCTRAVELALLVLQFDSDVTPHFDRSKTPIRFKELIDTMKSLGDEYPQEFQSINFSLYMSAAIQVRHMVAHNLTIGITRKAQDGVLDINIEPENRYGVFNDYLKELFLKYAGPRKANKCVIVPDRRFPEYTISLWVSKKANIDLQRSVTRFGSTIEHFVELLDGELFRVFTVLLQRVRREHATVLHS